VRLALARRGLSAPFHDLGDSLPERHPLGPGRILVEFVDAALNLEALDPLGRRGRICVFFIRARSLAIRQSPAA
jgi:hypothetical protein